MKELAKLKKEVDSMLVETLKEISKDPTRVSLRGYASALSTVKDKIIILENRRLSIIKNVQVFYLLAHSYCYL